MLGAFIAEALFALIGGWPSLAGIVVTVVLPNRLRRPRAPVISFTVLQRGRWTLGPA
ncbi:hypothetical protein [Streptomyces sp. NPDC006289]|uniref:hypothetical protein n=1 Tax=Streptomyces sp. NPDC006289 TaxID=3156744 RepID=UPI0033AF042E